MIHLDVANKFVLLSPLPVQKVHFRLIANDYGVGGGGGGERLGGFVNGEVYIGGG